MLQKNKGLPELRLYFIQILHEPRPFIGNSIRNKGAMIIDHGDLLDELIRHQEHHIILQERVTQVHLIQDLGLACALHGQGENLVHNVDFGPTIIEDFPFPQEEPARPRNV